MYYLNFLIQNVNLLNWAQLSLPTLSYSVAILEYIILFFDYRCLRSDIEYKTLIVNNSTTCRDLIWMLLSKYRMRHRDPKLFYLTMDIYIKRTGKAIFFANLACILHLRQNHTRFNPNWHELRKQEKCSSLAPPRSKFYKTQ